MRNSTYFGATGLGRTKPVVDPSPVRNFVELQRPNFQGSIVTQILDRIDVKLEAFWASVQSHQTAFFTANGRYWQGILTPTTIPRDGDEAAPELNVKPTDQAEDWAATAIAVPSTLPMSVEIHTHDGPSGKGYSAILTVRVLGEIWQRAQGFGSHALDSSWAQLGVATP